MKFISQITVGGETREILPNQIPFQVEAFSKRYVTLFKEGYYFNSNTQEGEYGLLPNFAPSYLDNKDIRESYFIPIGVMQKGGAYQLIGTAVASYFDGREYTDMGLLPYLKTYNNMVYIESGGSSAMGNLCFSPNGAIGVPYGLGLTTDVFGDIALDVFKDGQFTNSYSFPVIPPGSGRGEFASYLNVPMDKYLFGFGKAGVHLRIDTTPIYINSDLKIGLGSNENGLYLQVKD